MPKLYVHPDVKNYFSDVALADVKRDDAFRKKIVESYEQGAVFILNDTKLDFDKTFFANLSLDWVLQQIPEEERKTYKKIGGIKFIQSLQTKDHPLARNFTKYAFANDFGKTKYFAQQISYVEEQMNTILSVIFRDYKTIRPHTTWRLQDTICEDLHIDVYDNEMPHHLRIFSNLDTAHRIWYTSHDLDYLLKNVVPSFGVDYLARATPQELYRKINSDFFGGYEKAGREGLPKHIAFFNPGDLWIVDSRKISHQIFYGRKAISTEHQIEHQSMLRPDSHYFKMAEEVLKSAVVI